MLRLLTKIIMQGQCVVLMMMMMNMAVTTVPFDEYGSNDFTIYIMTHR